MAHATPPRGRAASAAVLDASANGADAGGREPGSLARAGQADHEAGIAWRDGNLARAAQLIQIAMLLDPARAEHWQERRTAINHKAGQDICPARPGLAAQTAARLARAGVTSADPALAVIRQWNAAIFGREAEAEAEA